MSYRKLRTGFLVLSVISLLSLLAAEFFLRIFLPLEPPPLDGKIFCQYDPRLGWVKTPNFEGQHVTPEYTVTEKFNSQGFRGPEYSLEKGENETRILVLGDSWTEGYMVEFEETFSQVLERELNQSGNPTPQFEVINAGTRGYSTDQQLLLFQDEGIKYQPDIVVVAFSSNDIWYNNQTYYSIIRGNKPKFELADGELVLTNVPVPLKEVIEPSKAAKLKNWVRSRSEIYRRATNVAGRAFRHVEPDKTKVMPDVFKAYLRKPGDDMKEAWEITGAILSELKKSCDSADAELLVAYISPEWTIYDDAWQKLKWTYTISDDDANAEQPRIDLERICRASNILFLDPTAQLKERLALRENERTELYFEIDGHWNATGNRWFGQILATFLEENSSIFDPH